jgi:hypothetical protein
MCKTDFSSRLRVYKYESSFALVLVRRVATRNTLDYGQRHKEPTVDAKLSRSLEDRQREISWLLVQTEKTDALAGEKVNVARKVAAVFTSGFVESFEEGLDRNVRSYLDTENAANQVWSVPPYESVLNNRVYHLHSSVVDASEVSERTNVDLYQDEA